MNEEMRQAFERLRAAYENGDLYRLYEASQNLHQLVKVAVGADLAREAYEMHNGD